MMDIVIEALLVTGDSLGLSLAVKATVVAALAFLVARLMRHGRASDRHLLFAGVFLVLPVLPFGAWLMPVIDLDLPIPSKPVAAALFAPVGDAETTDLLGASESLKNASRRPVRLSTVAVAVWAVGTIVFALPVVAGIGQLRRIRGSGVPWLQGKAILQRLADEGRIKRNIQVLLHNAIGGPMTFGVFRPAIVLPPDAHSWSEVDLQRSLIHELEHVRRGDFVIHSAARLVCALYWFHPLVWMSWRRLGLEAERACDDAVLRRAEAAEYADQLVTLAQRMKARPRSPLLAMADRSELATRIQSVLDAGRRRGRTGILGASAVLAGTALITGLLSPLWAVSVILQRETLQTTDQLPEFEVASVKLNREPGVGRTGMDFQPGGRVTATKAWLASLIMTAYRLDYKQLDVGEHAMMREMFDIDARAPADAIPPGASIEERNQILRLMLRKLLADRFKLILHKETIDMPLYALVAAKNGPRLRPSPPDRDCSENKCNGAAGPASGMKLRSADIAQLVSILNVFADRPVLDRTGIQGRFDIELPPWNPTPLQIPPADPNNDEPRPDPEGPSLFAVLEDALGLRFESIRGPYETYVVDHIERPGEN